MVHKADYESDTITLKCSREETKDIEAWCRQNMTFIGMGGGSAPQLGEWCWTPEEPGKRLKIESVDETACFPMRDKVTMIKNIMVISGCNAKHGSSGAPVFDSGGKIIAMIVGRSKQGKDYRYLAVNVGGLLERFAKTQRRVIED